VPLGFRGFGSSHLCLEVELRTPTGKQPGDATNDWLGKARERVQDDRNLIRLARSVIVGQSNGQDQVSNADLRVFVRHLSGAELGTELVL
jgi:hypothetical protein